VQGAGRTADEKLEGLRKRIRREMNAAERKEDREFERRLEAFTRAVAEVLAADDAKEAQKVIERLMAL
jgi:hypothetical protein